MDSVPAVTAVPDAAAADGPSRLPAIPVLSELTGLPGLTEEDREELQPAVSRLAAVIGRLASLGITTRAGDAVALTPLGSALLRGALILGTQKRTTRPRRHSQPRTRCCPGTPGN